MTLTDTHMFHTSTEEYCIIRVLKRGVRAYTISRGFWDDVLKIVTVKTLSLKSGVRSNEPPNPTWGRAFNYE